MSFFCFVCTWAMIIFAFFRSIQMLKAGREHLARLHNIPCSNCQYFTQQYSLKCTVHPYEALTEEALHCLDFEEASVMPAYPNLMRYVDESSRNLKSNIPITH